MTPQTSPWHRARPSDASAASETASSDAAPQRAAWPPPDPTHRELVAFLASSSEIDEVLVYLRKGPPYPGTALFEAKEQVKGCGARWVPNARAGEEGEPRGWWSAESVMAVEKLLALPKMSVQTRYGKSYEKAQWTPSLHNDSLIMMQIVKKTLRDFRAYESRRAAAAVADQLAAKQRRDEALRSSDLCIPPDDVKTVETLRCSPYFVDWNSLDGVSICCTNSNLGPHDGVSHAQRVLRGLRLDLLEPTGNESCLGGVRISKAEREREECTIAYRNRSNRRVQRSLAEDEAIASDATNAIVNTNVAMFGSGIGMIALPTDAEWEAMREQYARSHHQPTWNNTIKVPEYRPTICLRCETELLEQFMECSCKVDSRWKRCTVCSAAYNAEQRCACPIAGASDAVDWEAQQATIRRVLTERTEVGPGDGSHSVDDVSIIS